MEELQYNELDQLLHKHLGAKGLMGVVYLTQADRCEVNIELDELRFQAEPCSSLRSKQISLNIPPAPTHSFPLRLRI
eukprot:4925663-Amphidinium_carterae.1